MPIKNALCAIKPNDSWSIRKKKVPKYLYQSKKTEIKKSVDLFIIGWYDLSILNLAIFLERMLRIIQFNKGENLTEKKRHTTLNNTCLFDLIKWANSKNIFSKENYDKALRLAMKRDYFSHSLHPLTETTIVEDEKTGYGVIPLSPGFNIFIKGKYVDHNFSVKFDTDTNTISVNPKKIFERSCLIAIKDYYFIIKDIDRFCKKNGIKP